MLSRVRIIGGSETLIEKVKYNFSNTSRLRRGWAYDNDCVTDGDSDIRLKLEPILQSLVLCELLLD